MTEKDKPDKLYYWICKEDVKKIEKEREIIESNIKKLEYYLGVGDISAVEEMRNFLISQIEKLSPNQIKKLVELPSKIREAKKINEER